MLISNDSVRLTHKEKINLAKLTGSDPSHIKTIKQLENFVNAHLVNYRGRTAEEQLLRRMLESFLTK